MSWGSPPRSAACFVHPLAVVLLIPLFSVDAYLCTARLLVAFADNDSRGGYCLPTAGPWVTGHPGAGTLSSLRVYIIFSYVAWSPPTAPASRCLSVYPFMIKIFQDTGGNHSPGGKFIRGCLFIHTGGVVYFAAALDIFKAFLYPQPGDPPDGMIKPSRRTCSWSAASV